MSFFGFTSLITSILTMAVGIFVITRSIKTSLNKGWFLVSIFASLWSFCLFGVVDSNNSEVALLFQYILDISGIFIPVFFLYFILVLLELYDKFRKIFYFFFVTGFSISILSLTNLFKKGVAPNFGFKYWIDAGPLYVIFPVFFIILVVFSIFLILKRYHKLSVIKKRQALYILLTALIGFSGGITNFFPQLIGTYPFGSFFTIFYIFGIGYAIVKYRLMDIRLVISKSILYFTLVSTITIIFTSATFITGNILVSNSNVSKIGVGFLMSLIVVLALDPLKKLLAKWTDTVFYRGKIDYQEVLKKLSEITAKEINLKKLLIDLSKNIEELLKYKKVDFLYKADSSKIYRGIVDNDLVITEQDEIVKYLQDEKEILVIEELEMKAKGESSTEKSYLFPIVKRLKKMKIGLIAPVISEKKIIAFLIVNKKLSDDTFSALDLNLISVLVSQVANALEKAKLYNKVQGFNIKLRQEINQATRSLKLANDDLATRNKYLSALQRISNKITRSLDIEEVIQFIANSIRVELGFAAGIIDFIDKGRRNIYIGAMTRSKLIAKAISTLPKDPLDYRVSLSENQNLTVKVINTGQILKSDKLYDLLGPALGPKTSLLIQKVLNIHSIVSVPVYSKNKIIGAIDFFLKRKLTEIKKIDVEVMKSLADQTGLVVSNLKLYKEINQKNIDLQKANAYLKKLDKAKSEFLSVASHQLRTPLTGIKGYLSMILDGDFGKVDPMQKEKLLDIYNASDRMTREINVYLNVSRIESGRLKLNYAQINLEDLIKECIKDLKSTAQEKKLKINFKVDSKNFPLVDADSDKLKDVILNLIDNAIKYTPHGKIDILLSQIDDNHLSFQIKDTGIGLDKDGIEKLFSKFSRGDGISKINTDGSGLGLYIVKKIIEAHGGRAWVESPGIGKGSIFQFTLPIKSAKK